MATSGTAYTNIYKTSRFYCSWSRTNYSSSGNYSDISWSAGLYISGNDEWYSNAVRINSVVINGSTVMESTTVSNKYGPGWFQIDSGTARIYHDDDGTKSFTISISGWLYSDHNLSGSDDFTLDTIPRYPTGCSISVSSKTINSVSIDWSTNENCSQIQYKIGENGSWVDVETNVNKKSGSYTITGLSPNTSYTIYGDFKRYDSGLWAQTKPSVTVKTYNIATVTSAPNIDLGDEATIIIANPGSASIKYFVEILNPTETVLKRDASTGSNTIVFSDAELDMIFKKMGTSNSTTLRFGVATNESYWDWKDKTCTLKGNQKTGHIKVNNSWLRGKHWIKVNGNWKRAVMWEKANGAWHRCI